MLTPIATPAGASAHLRSGTVAVDYQASISTPRTVAYTARVFQSDRALSLTLERGHTVVLLGYLSEPVCRLDADGLSVNAASPTAAAVGLLKKGQLAHSPLPTWRVTPGRATVVWHDARVQRLPAGIDRGVWSVPLVVDGRRTRLDGELRRFPAPAMWPWVAILCCLLLTAGSPLILRRGDQRLARQGSILLAWVASAASVVLALAFAFDAYASPGTWIAGLDEIVFLAVGIGMLRRGPNGLHVAAAIGLGLLALAIGLSKGAVFFHPIVLAILPATLTRVTALAAIGAGAAASLLGGAFYARSPESITRALPDSYSPGASAKAHSASLAPPTTGSP